MTLCRVVVNKTNGNLAIATKFAGLLHFEQSHSESHMEFLNRNETKNQIEKKKRLFFVVVAFALVYAPNWLCASRFIFRSSVPLI